MSKELQKKELGEENKLIQVNQEGYVTLPFKGEDFKEFIRGLLGKPQTIDAEIRGNFEIEVEDIRNIYGLLSQRINQQNDATLIQFRSRISFSDGTSVLLNSFEELITYNEIKPIISEEIHLTFLYLIKFNDKEVPEKQEINVSFISTDSESKEFRKSINSKLSFFLRRFMFSNKENEGYIQFSIKHTARTWGTDIETLLSNHLKSVLKPESWLKRTINNRLIEISLGIAFIVITICIWGISQVKKNKKAEIAKDIKSIFESSENQTLETISKQIKYTLEFLNENAINKIDELSAIVPLIGVFVFFVLINTVKLLKFRSKITLHFC